MSRTDRFFLLFSLLFFPKNPPFQRLPGQSACKIRIQKKPHAAGVLLHKALVGFISISFLFFFFPSFFSGFEDQKFCNFRSQGEWKGIVRDHSHSMVAGGLDVMS